MSKGITISTQEMDVNFADTLISEIEEQLAYIGEKAIAEARSTEKANDWQDRTGNLRSSIGYVVLKDGKPLAQSQAQAFSGEEGDGSQGVAEGQALLTQLQSQFPKGLVLVVCAGMNYASYVESKGLNVLTSAEQIVETLVNKLVSTLQKN